MPFLGGFCQLPGRLTAHDAETGLSAAQHARLAADTLAKKRTGPLCVITWAAVGAPDTAPTITTYRGMNGVGLAHAPDTSVKAPDGIAFGWTNPRFVDPYEVAEPIAVRHAVISIASATAAYCTYEILQGGSGVSIFVFNDAGVALNPQPGGTCTLW